ncbi:MAG: hypothetical protein C5B50_07880 [Verrucomicrobia bacterium]|nr:MAG: hypothetical protein C5B50_07880 [Verrucomicrobiota bacterium]
MTKFKVQGSKFKVQGSPCGSALQLMDKVKDKVKDKVSRFPLPTLFTLHAPHAFPATGRPPADWLPATGASSSTATYPAPSSCPTQGPSLAGLFLVQSPKSKVQSRARRGAVIPHSALHIPHSVPSSPLAKAKPSSTAGRSFWPPSESAPLVRPA